MTSNKDRAIAFLSLAASGRVDVAYRDHVSPRFRHHNPYFRGDAGSLKAAMAENAAKNPGKIFEVHRALEDGDLVAVHSHVRQSAGEAGAAVADRRAVGRRNGPARRRRQRERHVLSP